MRPSFGLLLDFDPERCSQQIQIKYTGSGEEVARTKLQINWIAIESSPELVERKFNHQEFNELYKATRANTKNPEGSIIIPFSVKEGLPQPKLNETSEVQDSRNSSEHDRSEEIPSPTLPTVQTAGKKVEKDARPKEVSVEIEPNFERKGFSLKTVLIVMFLGVALGVIAGMQIERYLNADYSMVGRLSQQQVEGLRLNNWREEAVQ